MAVSLCLRICALVCPCVCVYTYLCVCDCVSKYLAVHVCVPKCGCVSGSLVVGTCVSWAVPEGVSLVPRGPNSLSWFFRAGTEWGEVIGRHGSKGTACMQCAGGSANIQPS